MEEQAPSMMPTGSARLGAEQMLNKYGLTGGRGSSEPAVQEGAWQTGRSDHFQCPPCTGTHPTGDHPVWEDAAAGETCLRAVIPARIKPGSDRVPGRKWVCPGGALPRSPWRRRLRELWN